MRYLSIFMCMSPSFMYFNLVLVNKFVEETNICCLAKACARSRVKYFQKRFFVFIIVVFEPTCEVLNYLSEYKLSSTCTYTYYQSITGNQNLTRYEEITRFTSRKFCTCRIPIFVKNTRTGDSLKMLFINF